MLGTQFLSSDVYFINYLPSQLIWSDVVLICAAGLGMSFLADAIPGLACVAYRASGGPAL